jgi:nucleoside-diphosphate-sugar epimerase
MFCDSSKARDRLGWKPRHSLAEGLAKTIDWYREQNEAGNAQFFSAPRGREAP